MMACEPSMTMTTIPTEPIGSIPRPAPLRDAMATLGASNPQLEALFEDAVRDTIEQFEATGSPVITDGEQRKYHNFWTYSVQGLRNTAPDGFKIPFTAGHTRRMLRLTAGPFAYRQRADDYLAEALRHAHVPVKQAVISPSALSLMYPAEGIDRYPRERFIEELLDQHEREVRACLALGAHAVQIDFTEGRLAVKLDRSGRWRVLRTRSASGSACTPVPAATATRPTAPMSTTRRFCRRSFRSTSPISTSRLPASPIACRC
jgi:5-methyltetrahydropteroyltriglutamate--homocysteine methyltransferase